MKNEERHIQDWIYFHALAGVKHFILYDNGSTDRTVELGSNFPDLNISIIPWVFNAAIPIKKTEFFLSQQILAYCHAISTFGANYRWMAFIDIDEIIIPKRVNNLEEALIPLEHFSSISLPWTMYGPNKHQAPPKKPQFFAYTTRAKHHSGELLNFKCIVDPSKIMQVNVHNFGTSDLGKLSCNDVGVLVRPKKRRQSFFISRQNIQLNHYFTRSSAEMEEKISKGDVAGFTKEQRKPSVYRKFEEIEDNLVSDLSAIHFLERIGIVSAERFCLSLQQGCASFYECPLRFKNPP